MGNLIQNERSLYDDSLAKQKTNCKPESNHLLNQLIKPEVKSTFEVDSVRTGNKLVITINKIQHLIIPDITQVTCVQSYYDGDNDSVCTIEIYFLNKKESIKLEYDSDDKWIKILNCLNVNL